MASFSHNPDKPIKVSLLGDSLIHKACESYQLIEKFQAIVSGYNVTFTDNGSNGSKIVPISQIYAENVLPTNPDVVILLWDSDVSNVDENVLPKDEVEKIRAEYVSTLKQLVEDINNSGAFLLIGGPTVLGEGTMLGAPQRFWNKKKMLDDYRQMNREVAESHGVKYVDVREAFITRRPWHHLVYKGTLAWLVCDRLYNCIYHRLGNG